MWHKIDKIRKMPVREICFRALKLVRKQADRYYLSRRSTSVSGFMKLLALPDECRKNPSSLLEYYRTRNNVKFFFDPEQKTNIISVFDKYFSIKDIEEKAGDVSNHCFSFLSRDFEFAGPIPWQTNPVTNIRYPNIYHSDVPYDFDSFGDVKYLWELNRCEFLTDLGKSFFLAGNHENAEKLWSLLESWVSGNPYLMGINWTGPLEVAVRSISWIFSYYYTLDSQALTPERNLLFLKSLNEHGIYLRKYLEIYESPYNHLIGEATGLFMIAVLFPELPDAAKWQAYSCRVLNENAEKQFYKDGGSVEQATFYHHYSLGFLVMYLTLLTRNGTDASSVLWKTVENAMEFSMNIIKPDKKVPMIGDVDNARSVPVEHDKMWDFRDILCIGSALFKRPDFKYVADGFRESALWITGTKGFEVYDNIKPESPEKISVILPDSGYFVMRTGWESNDHYLCFDAGSQAEGLFYDSTPSAAHGHSDALSFILSSYGKDILTDPAIYTYNGEYEWEAYFRGTAAHNTIKIDNRDQAEYHGAMTWSHTYKTACHKIISNEFADYIEAGHDGYLKKSGIMHYRTVLFVKPYYWVLKDILEGENEHHVESFLHFAPDVQLDLDPTERMIRGVCNTGEGVSIHYSPIFQHAEIKKGGSKPEHGWAAYGYGNTIPSPTVRMSENADLPLSSYMILVPTKSDQSDFKIESNFEHPDCSVTTIKNNGFQSRIYIKNDDAKDMTAEDVITDASFLIHTEQAHKTLIILIDGTFCNIFDKNTHICNGFSVIRQDK
ncbi:MAG: hypothetical protein GY749_40715 [Desulfobacteraceae bacterium]|nr:hypothetical protein [Desulfobacteraceae bacterium]